MLPLFSDKQHKRQWYLKLGYILAIPGLVGLAFGMSLEQLFLSSFALGFFLVSTNPLGMQDAVEISTYPGGNFLWTDPAFWSDLGGVRLYHGKPAILRGDKDVLESIERWLMLGEIAKVGKVVLKEDSPYRLIGKKLFKEFHE